MKDKVYCEVLKEYKVPSFEDENAVYLVRYGYVHWYKDGNKRLAVYILMRYKDKNLSKDKLFEIEQDKLLGIMRIDWYDGGLSNRWNPSDLMIDFNNKKELDIKILQEEINYIQFQLLRDFSIVEKLCNGRGYGKELVFYIGLDKFVL